MIDKLDYIKLYNVFSSKHFKSNEKIIPKLKEYI